MSLFLQIMICIWIISTVSVIIAYSALVSNKNFTGLVNVINKSETLNLFGKIFSNLLYCPNYEDEEKVKPSGNFSDIFGNIFGGL